MLGQDEIKNQQELLAAHRVRLAVLLKQQATLGESHTPPGTITEINAARSEIQRIKAALRASGVAVDDAPNDDPLPGNPLPDSAHPDGDAERFQPSPVGAAISIAGDQIGGDKIGGDKVGRDKITDNRRGVFWDQARIPLFVVIAVILLFTATSIVMMGANVGGFKWTLQNIGVLPPDPTPIPTATPAPTAELLLFQPEQAGETLIVIAPFLYTEGISNTAAHKEIRRAIQNAIKTIGMSNLRVEIAADSLEADDRNGAEQLGARYNASIVVWGEDTGVRVTVNFLNRREPTVDAASVTIDETQRVQMATQPDAYVQFITQDLPRTVSFLSLFAVGQSAYTRQDHPTATQVISYALDELKGVNSLPEGIDAAYFRLGWLYQVSERDNARARAAYDQAIALNSRYAEAYNNRGNIYRDLQMLDKALTDYNLAIKYGHRYTKAYYNRGLLHMHRNECDAAITDFRWVLTQSNDPQYRQDARDWLRELRAPLRLCDR